MEVITKNGIKNLPLIKEVSLMAGLSNPSTYDSIPPSEKESLVIEVASGCSYNKCTFCNFYRNEGFKMKSEEVLNNQFSNFLRVASKYRDTEWIDLKNNPYSHTKNGVDYYKNNSTYRKKKELTSLDLLERAYLNNEGLSYHKVFLGNGNALAINKKSLVNLMDKLMKSNNLIHNTELRQISMYGRVVDINKKSNIDFYDLRKSGLEMVYVGYESGSNAVLEYVKKGQTKGDIVTASKKLHGANINHSAMIIAGLGGKKFSDDHVKETIKLLRKARPEYVTFLGINPYPNLLYSKNMNLEIKEGRNRHLTPEEMKKQIHDIVGAMPLTPKMKFGMHDSDIDTIGINPSFFNQRLETFEDKDKALESIIG